MGNETADELAKKALKYSRINVNVPLGKADMKGLIPVVDTERKGMISRKSGPICKQFFNGPPQLKSCL